MFLKRQFIPIRRERYVLAEARATRTLSWEQFVMTQLREKCVDGSELERQFMLQVGPSQRLCIW